MSTSSTYKTFGWQRAKENPSSGIQKLGKSSTLRRSARLQAKGSPIKPTSCVAIPECLQDPSETPRDLSDTPQTRRRKQPHGSENERPENERSGKRQRTAPQVVREHLICGSIRKPLSERNLRTHNRLLETDQDDQGSQQNSMDGTSSSAPSKGGRGKRKATDEAQSRTESHYSLADSQTSKRASSSSSYYRWSILQRVQIYISSRPPPEEIQERVDAIIEKASPHRKALIATIGEKLCDDFANVLEIAAGEDDCLELFYHALSSMDDLRRLTFQRKADWYSNLKPRVPPTPWDMSFLNENQRNFAAPTVPLSEPPLADSTFPTPRLSVSTAIGKSGVTDGAPRNKGKPQPTPPLLRALPADPLRALPADPEKESALVKTPRPDITTGIPNALIVSKLQAYGFDSATAKGFLEVFRQRVIRNGRDEQLLCSEPTQRALNIRFPFLIVEGKAYATGGTLFEAQNQAAVSGACALKILHDLADLADRADLADVTPGPHTTTHHPLVFSICTQGPYHELWAHYTMMENDVRMFKMDMLETCHTSKRNDALRFLTAVDNVLGWGSGQFLDDIVMRLAKVAKRAGPAYAVCSTGLVPEIPPSVS